MIKLFKKIRRKIWDWRMNRLVKRFADYFKRADLWWGLADVKKDEVIASSYKDEESYKLFLLYWEEAMRWDKLADKILTKIRKLDAKINGQK